MEVWLWILNQLEDLSLNSFSLIALLLVRFFQMKLRWSKLRTRGWTVARARMEDKSRKGINWATRSGLLQNLFSTAMLAHGQQTTARKCNAAYFLAITFPFMRLENTSKKDGN